MIENKDRLLPLDDGDDDDDASTITDDVEKADRSIDPRTKSCIFIVCVRRLWESGDRGGTSSSQTERQTGNARGAGGRNRIKRFEEEGKQSKKK